jgi:hypothetical protein
MRYRTLAAAAALTAFVWVSPTWADNFDFSFTDSFGNTNATVTGEIFGLASSGSSSATDVKIFSITPTAYGLTIPAGGLDVSTWNNFTGNSFTVTGGKITAAALDVFTGTPASKKELLEFEGLAELTYGTGASEKETDTSFSSVTFTPATAPVPLPSPVILLGSALLGVLVIGRRRGQRDGTPSVTGFAA